MYILGYEREPDTLQGYMLDVPSWELSKSDEEYFQCAVWIVDNKCSIRQMSKDCLVARSTFHTWYKKKLRGISYELYLCVRRQLKLNKDKYFR